MSRLATLSIAMLLLVGGRPASAGSSTTVVMFVDLTPSIADQAAIEGLADVAKEVVTRLPSNAHLYVYPIDRSRAASHIFEFENKPSRKMSDKKRLTEAKTKAGEDLRNLVLARRKAFLTDTASRTEPISCILRSLEVANTLFDRTCAPANGVNCWLIYLSDMVEDCANLSACGDKPCGRMVLTKEGYRDSRTALREYAPGFSLTNVQVAVVAAAENGTANDKNASCDDRKAFWTEAFSKAGLSTRDHDIGFLSTLPSWVLRGEGIGSTTASR